MFERIVVVTKRTKLEELLARQSLGQVRFRLQSRGLSSIEYEREHEQYQRSLTALMAALPLTMPHVVVRRDNIPGFLFREQDLVIAIGPDGLCVNVLKYLAGQPLLGINPDPLTVAGILMPYLTSQAIVALPAILAGRYTCDETTMALAETNDGQKMLAVNDFLIGRRDHVSALYTLSKNGQHERQSSSGVLVATGVGSSGWLRSILTGATGLTNGKPIINVPWNWDEPQLFFVVREPFQTRHTKSTIIWGGITAEERLVITSEMPEGGAIISDGIVEDAIDFTSGTTVTIGISPVMGRLIAPL